MTTDELQALISRQVRQAVGETSDDISVQRAELFERYMGEPYGDEVEDRSSVVSTDIADTVESILPDLMDIFTSGERVVEFDPQGPEDERAAEQETEVVNHVFYRKNEGWLTLYSAVKDALIQKNGYIKRIWEERETVTTEEYEGLTEAERMQVDASLREDGASVEYLRLQQDEAGFFAVEARVTKEDKHLSVVPVPPEEVLVSPRWNKPSLQGCPFVAHRREVPVSDLVEMGYERKQVEALPRGDLDDGIEEKIERFSTRDAFENSMQEATDESMKPVMVHECYLRADYDGDGKAELRRVMCGGTGFEVLRKNGQDDNEEVEDIPFHSWSPVLIPHRHYGRSVAELVDDIQRIKTTLTRQMLDNVYLGNNPRREIAEAGIIPDVTISDMLVERPGAIVRTRAPGHYQEHAPAPFLGQMLPAIEYIDTVRENRTGVTRYNQGLDADSLNKTATGFRGLMSQAQKKVRLIARICAEVLLRPLFLGIHADLRRGSSRRMAVQLRGKYIEVDPRSWKSRSDMVVSVGLGTGDRETQLAQLGIIIQKQEQHLMQGSPMVTLANLHHSYEKFIEAAGFKNVDAFFRRPQPQEQAPQGGRGQGQDPSGGLAQAAMMQTQLEAQSAQQKLQLETQKAMLEHQRQMMKMQMEDDRERDKLNLQIAAKLQEINAKTDTAITLEQIKAAAASVSQVNTLDG